MRDAGRSHYNRCGGAALMGHIWRRRSTLFARQIVRFCLRPPCRRRTMRDGRSRGERGHRLIDIRPVLGTVRLLHIAHPARVVDASDSVSRRDHHASVLVGKGWAFEVVLLRAFERDRAVRQVVAGRNLHGIPVSRKKHPDARELALQTSNVVRGPSIRTGRRSAIDQERVVVSRAVGSAIAPYVLGSEVVPKILGDRPKVPNTVQAILEDLSRRDAGGVRLHSLT